MFKRIIFLLVIIAIVFLGVVFIGGEKEAEVCQGDDCEAVKPEEDVVVTSPLANEVVSETIIIEGRAKGTWFFEATMPVNLLAQDGTEIAIGFVEATSDWMVEDHVPFKGELKFVMPEGIENGILVFKTANAAGLPQFDDSFEVPVRFSE